MHFAKVSLHFPVTSSVHTVSLIGVDCNLFFSSSSLYSSSPSFAFIWMHFPDSIRGGSAFYFRVSACTFAFLVAWSRSNHQTWWLSAHLNSLFVIHSVQLCARKVKEPTAGGGMLISASAPAVNGGTPLPLSSLFYFLIYWLLSLSLFPSLSFSFHFLLIMLPSPSHLLPSGLDPPLR